MIVNFQELRKQNEEKEFDLGEAIRNDEVDLVFGYDAFSYLEESYKQKGKGNMVMLIRNKKEDEIGHGFSMKFIPTGERKDDKTFYHNGHYGLPITFTRKDKKWYVYFGPGKRSLIDAKVAEDSLTKKEKKFIDSVVINIGDDIIDYWEVENPNSNNGQKELNDIVERIKNKYEK